MLAVSGQNVAVVLGAARPLLERCRYRVRFPLVVAFLVLGYLGVKPTTVWGQFGFDAFFLDTKERATWMARLCTLIYFAFFILMPWYTAKDKVKPVPDRVTM